MLEEENVRNSPNLNRTFWFYTAIEYLKLLKKYGILKQILQLRIKNEYGKLKQADR